MWQEGRDGVGSLEPEMSPEELAAYEVIES